MSHDTNKQNLAEAVKHLEKIAKDEIAEQQNEQMLTYLREPDTATNIGAITDITTSNASTMMVRAEHTNIAWDADQLVKAQELQQQLLAKSEKERNKPLTRAEVKTFRDQIFTSVPYVDVLWAKAMLPELSARFAGSNVIVRVYADKTEKHTLLEMHYYGWNLGLLEHERCANNATLVCALAQGGKASEDAAAILEAYDTLELNANELPGYVTEWLRTEDPRHLRDLFEPVTKYEAQELSYATQAPTTTWTNVGGLSAGTTDISIGGSVAVTGTSTIPSTFSIMQDTSATKKLGG